MSDTSIFAVPPAEAVYSRRTAIVGVGESDYRADYQAARAKAPDFEPPSPEALATTAFERALADCGLRRDQIDGISVSFLYGGPDTPTMAAHLGLSPEYESRGGGIMAGILPRTCADVIAGKCETVAMIYAVASRSIGRQYGGSTYQADDLTPSSYYYHHPWGWSSQAAHWAMIFTFYREMYGVSEADLGAVAMQLRRHALSAPNAVMRTPMSLDDYLASRYIVRPLRLFDMCLVNDGAVCLIVTSAERARDLRQVPVEVAGWGEARIKGRKMDRLVRERLRPELAAAGEQALAMAGLDLSAVQHLEAYDPASIHLVNQIEGYGFAPPGEGLGFVRDGQISVGGRLPTNMAGGMMSGSYMHGWNLVAETVHQLRHDAGDRQVPGVETSLFSLAQTDQAHPIVFTRGA